jgi:hypothetical protein
VRFLLTFLGKYLASEMPALRVSSGVARAFSVGVAVDSCRFTQRQSGNQSFAFMAQQM